MTETSTYKHWFELNPSRLEMEKMAMAQHFPEFEFLMVNDGEIRYSGTLKSEKFKRPEGYSVYVDYGDGGLDNFGNPGIVISPISPDFNALFPASGAYTEELQRKLLNQVAIDMKCIGYEDPAIEQTPTIITAASLLKKVIDWLVKYETEKGKIEQVDNQYHDAIARKRQELINRLKNGDTIVKVISGEFYVSTNDIEEMDDSISPGEIERLGYTIADLKKKCVSYFDLLPKEEQNINIPKEEWDNYLKLLNKDYDPTLSNIDHALKPSIQPYFIFNDIKELIIIGQDNPLKIYQFPLPGGGYYSFNTDCIKFRFNAKSLILFYFIKHATNFFLPLIWHSNYGYKKIILNDIDKPKSDGIFNKDIDSEIIASLPVGIEVPRIENGKVFRFNYYYWHNWTGYVKCKVCITSLSDTELLNEKDINIEESKVILYHYNCGIRY